MDSKLSYSDPYSAPLLNVAGSVEIKGEESASLSGCGMESTSLELDPYSAPFLNSMGLVEIEDEELETRSAAICRICLEHKGDSGEELIAPCKCKGTQQFVHRTCLDHWRSVKEGFAFAHCTTCMAEYHLRVNFLEGYCWRNMKFRMFVTKDILLVFFAIQTMISILGGLSYLFDLNGEFRKSIGHGWDRVFSDHPVLFYYCLGALLFLAFLGIYGLVLQCILCAQNNSNNIDAYDDYSSPGSTESNFNGYRSTEPIGCCCWGPCSIDCSGSNSDAGEGFILVIFVLIVIFAIIGIFYGIFAGTIGIQRIWQRHYHILTKRELTKEYVVEDLHGHYTALNLDREHAERLRMLKLL